VVIGFSKDGAFFAFERAGTHDGSGFPFSEIFILNVCKNEYATKPIRFDNEAEDATEESTSALNLKQAKSFLDKFGIVKGNSGLKVFSASADVKSSAQFQYRDEKMKLVLEQTPTQTENCMPDLETRKMTLSLSYKGAIQVLQKDKQLPKSRACAFSYTIREVYCYSSTIVVLIDYQSPGYEGPDLRQIAVTGCLK
jgi:predicted secreted protein